jgi:photosystem II stability/assembly factor-like uncharacterized protein
MRNLFLRPVGLAFLAFGIAVGSLIATSRHNPILPAGESEEEETTFAERAHEWRRLAWLDEKGKVDPLAHQRAIEQRDANYTYFHTMQGDGFPRVVSPILWQERGPDNIAGRTRSLLIDPTNPNLMFAGTVGGGIWKSTNGGTSWSVVDDWFASLAIGCMAFDPNNPSVIYAGTGEGFFNSDAIAGAGIYKSIDGGLTWSLMPGTSGFGSVCRIAVSAANSNIILVSSKYGGIRRTTNGGSSWSTTYPAQGSFQVLFDPTNPNKVVAHVIDYDFDVSNWYHRAVYSTDAGATWTTATGLDKVWEFGSRLELAYAASSPNIVYASVASGGGKVWKSTDGGRSYTQVTVTGSSGCSWYACPIWVDPTNPNVVVVGGTHVFRSLDGGVTLSQISNGYINTTQPHPDTHNFVAAPGYNGVTNKKLYVCNDGGIYSTNDILTATQSNTTWTRLDRTCHVTQFYGAAGDGPTGRIVGGTQDNGHLTLNTGSNNAILTFGGDGGFVAMDSTNANYLYGEYVNLRIHRSTNAGGSASYIYNGITDAGSAANFIAPFVLDPNNQSVMLAGGARLWRTSNVKAATVSWANIRPANSANISAIAVAPGNSNIVWIGQNDGVIQKTVDGAAVTPTWTDVDNNDTVNPIPNRYITRILIDPADSNTVYIALGGYSDGNLLKTTNGGSSWTDITGSGVTGLPFSPTRGIARHPTQPNWLYAGTEVGLFQSTNGGATWSSSDFGPNNVCIDELVFMHNSFTLLAATHGRGIFTGSIPDPNIAPTSYNLLRGSLVAGTLADTATSNDARLTFKNGPVLSPAESPITVTFDTTSPFTSATDLRILLEANASFVTLQQSIDLFDFQANAWVTLDARQATTADSTVSVSGFNPSRFVQASTRLVRTRIRYKANGPVLSNNWQGRIDRLVFQITP